MPIKRPTKATANYISPARDGEPKTILTPERRLVLDTIRAYRREFQCSPSRHDIGQVLGITDSTAREHVDRLVLDGYLGQGKGYRTIFVTRKGQRVPELSKSSKSKPKPTK